MLFASTLFAITADERMASQLTADKAAVWSWKSFENSWLELLTCLWWMWPFWLLGMIVMIAYDVFVTNRKNDRRQEEETAHRREMQQLDKLLEMHKAGMKVTLPSGNPDTPEPAKEVVDEPKEVLSEPKPPA